MENKGNPSKLRWSADLFSFGAWFTKLKCTSWSCAWAFGVDDLRKRSMNTSSLIHHIKMCSMNMKTLIFQENPSPLRTLKARGGGHLCFGLTGVCLPCGKPTQILKEKKTMRNGTLKGTKDENWNPKRDFWLRKCQNTYPLGDFGVKSIKNTYPLRDSGFKFGKNTYPLRDWQVKKHTLEGGKSCHS